uniref:Uncharacterized protein n=1 Tax=Caenorhabditis japonica TaxID=281687 RepID=A0A8R1DGB9_CAEJA
MTSTIASNQLNHQDGPFDEINSYVTGIISLIGNVALIYATTRVKVYSSSFRRVQYYVCALRIAFSLVVALTSPVSTIFLILFIFFVVISCCSPTVQYLQLCHLLSDNGHKHEQFGPIISLISVLTGIPALALAAIGYLPTTQELYDSREIVYYLNGQGDSPFLIVTVRKRLNPYTGEHVADWTAGICTFYILTIMVLSIITVIVSNVYIQYQLKKKMMSPSAKSSQNQVNLILALQFSLPFLTIHVPFYVSFILPMFDMENNFLSANLPYLFSWCPAINPILVLCLVKVRKTMNRALPEYSENHDESKKRKMTFAEGRLLKSSDREEVKNRQ